MLSPWRSRSTTSLRSRFLSTALFETLFGTDTSARPGGVSFLWTRALKRALSYRRERRKTFSISRFFRNRSLLGNALVTTATPSVFFSPSDVCFGPPPGQMRFGGALGTHGSFCVFSFLADKSPT